MNKVSIRFFDDREVRAIWDEGKQLGSVTTQFKLTVRKMLSLCEKLGE